MEDKLKKLLIQSQEEISPDFTMRLMDNIYLQKALKNQKYNPIIPPIFFKIIAACFIILLGSIFFYIPESGTTNETHNYFTLNINLSIKNIFDTMREYNIYLMMIGFSIIAFAYYLLDVYLQRKFNKFQTQ